MITVVQDVAEIELVARSERRMGISGSTYELEAQAVHVPTETIVAERVLRAAVRLDEPRFWREARRGLLSDAEEWLGLWRSRLRARPGLGGRSVYQVAPWLDGWGVLPVNPTTGRCRIVHPFTRETWLVIWDAAELVGGWPTDEMMLEKVLERCLPGPDDVEAEALGGGEVAVGCEVVAGAAGYQWWARASGGRWALWAEGPAEGSVAQGLAPGWYEVRAAAEDGAGQVGCGSREVSVEVG